MTGLFGGDKIADNCGTPNQPLRVSCPRPEQNPKVKKLRAGKRADWGKIVGD